MLLGKHQNNIFQKNERSDNEPKKILIICYWVNDDTLYIIVSMATRTLQDLLTAAAPPAPPPPWLGSPQL